jgi:hypothetical protein
VPQRFFLWQLWHFSLKVLALLPQSLPQMSQSANPVPQKDQFEPRRHKGHKGERQELQQQQ